MMPTIHQFTRALLAPRPFATLSRAEVRCDASGMPLLTRTSRFVEVEIDWQEKRWLLSLPLNSAASCQAERIASALRTCDSPILTEYRILPQEISWADDCNQLHKSNLVLQLKPSGGGFYETLEFVAPSDLIAALDYLEAEFRRVGFAHRNLKPENLRWSNGCFYPLRYHDAIIGSSASEELQQAMALDAAAFESLRQKVRASHNALRKWESERFRKPDMPEHKPFFEGLACIEQNGLYGYIDTEGRTVIEPQYGWAGEFHEGRAEVQTDTGMGLIDRAGKYILPPEYEIVDYDPYKSTIFARRNGLWAQFNYLGQQISPYSEKHNL